MRILGKETVTGCDRSAVVCVMSSLKHAVHNGNYEDPIRM